MLENLCGFYINLDSSSDRNEFLQQHLSTRGLLEKYQRFNATALDKEKVATATVPKFSTPSLMGNWLSHFEIINQNIKNDFPLHICEDDIYFPDAFLSHLNKIHLPKQWDILFLDAFLPKEFFIYEQFRPCLKKFLNDDQISLISLNDLGFNGSTTSYIINPDSKQKLSQLLDFNTNSSNIAFIDQYLSQLILHNKIKAYCTFPFLTSLSAHAHKSTLQDVEDEMMSHLYHYRKSIFIDTLKDINTVDSAFLEVTRCALNEPKQPIQTTPNPFHQELLFAAPLQIFHVPNATELNAGLFNDVQRWCNKPNDGYRSSFGGQRSYEDIFEDSSEYVQQLLPYIQESITNYLSTHIESMIKVTNESNFDIDVTPWAYLLQVGDFMKPHLHPDGFITGVYYVKVPTDITTDEGALVLMAPDTGRSLVPHPSTVADSVTYRPKAGDLLLFPSYIPHYVNPFKNSERAVIAFDIKLKLNNGRE
ncbi:MAG: putative 2OG-Fe(II) oxygenase [Pseudomonadota bacterium]